MNNKNATIKDIYADSYSGIPLILCQLAGAVLILLVARMMGGGLGMAVLLAGGIAEVVMFGGYYTVAPNQAAVLSLFGEYMGTVHDNGLRWNNIFYSKQLVSRRVNNFESARLKVNDLDGNPIEIAAVVVWRVEDAASALLAVSNYEQFVHLQAESAVRALAGHYAYDSHNHEKPSLRDNPEEISKQLMGHIQERLSEAGIVVLEARISHLAYSPEIAQAMLQRQQASAVVAARATIVAGAVGIVEMALEQLSVKNMVNLDDERKAQMVSNLLVVLCSDRAVQPVVNAGSIHS